MKKSRCDKIMSLTKVIHTAHDIPLFNTEISLTIINVKYSGGKLGPEQ